jgi:copper chaperone CopZ
MDKNGQQAVFDLEGAHCGSCAFAIEHSGRKIKGVDYIRVDPGARRIYVDYHADDGALEKIVDIVDRLGYRAVLRESD